MPKTDGSSYRDAIYRRAPVAGATRADRFLAQRVSFASLTRDDPWHEARMQNGERFVVSVGMFAAKSRLLRCLDGHALARLGEIAGEDVLDAVLESSVPDTGSLAIADLHPTELAACGASVLEAASRGDAACRKLAETALRTVPIADRRTAGA